MHTYALSFVPCKCQMWEKPLIAALKIESNRPLHCGKFRRLRPQKYKPKIQGKSTKINNRNKCKTKANKIVETAAVKSSHILQSTQNQMKSGREAVGGGAWGKWKNTPKEGVHWKKNRHFKVTYVIFQQNIL